MTRSRVRERERIRAAVQTTDPAELAAYAGALRPGLHTSQQTDATAFAPNCPIGRSGCTSRRDGEMRLPLHFVPAPFPVTTAGSPATLRSAAV